MIRSDGKEKAPVGQKLKGEHMEEEGLLLVAQADHLSGEEIGWALEVLSIPGVRNRNLIPTLTKKGRTGYVLLVDIDRDAEAVVARLLLETFGIYGYHKMQTRHVHQKVVIEEVAITIDDGKKSITGTVRIKRLAEENHGLCFLESDDLFSMQKRIDEELGARLSPKDLRRRIEALAEKNNGGMIHLALQ